MATTVKKILITGNEAIGEAAIQCGCRFYAGYPITPQNELTAYMAKRMHDVSGVFIQAESELAAVNMVLGATAAGARAMTTSSSPGISLKQEGISYLAGCQLPAVIVNVMRAGPGLGGIGPSQSDYFQATRGGGHGDYRLIVLVPSSAQEAFDFTVRAFDLSDAYRIPSLILIDAVLGQMAEPVRIQHIRGQDKHTKDSWALTGARKRKAHTVKSFFLKGNALEKHNLHLQEKYERIKKEAVQWECHGKKDAPLLFVAYGISFRIALSAAFFLKTQGIEVTVFCPKTVWPFPYKQLREAAKNKKHVFVFELSYGQMLEDVRLALEHMPLPVHFLGRAGGAVFEKEDIVRFVRSKIKK